MATTARIEGKKLIIESDLNDPPVLSKTAKSMVLASTHGNVPTAAQFKGKPIVIGLNAYFKP